MIESRGVFCETGRATVVIIFAKRNVTIENRPAEVSPALVGGAVEDSLTLVGGAAEVSPTLVGRVAEVSPTLVDGVAEVSPTLVGGAAEINRFCVVRVRKVYWVEEGASREIVFKV